MSVETGMWMAVTVGLAMLALFVRLWSLAAQVDSLERRLAQLRAESNAMYFTAERVAARKALVKLLDNHQELIQLSAAKALLEEESP